MNNKTLNVNNNTALTERKEHKRRDDWGQEIEMMEMKTTAAPPQSSPLSVHRFARHVRPQQQQRSHASTDLDHSCSSSLISKTTDSDSLNVTSKSPSEDTAYSSSSSLPSRITNSSNVTSKSSSADQDSASSLKGSKAVSFSKEQNAKRVQATSMEILTAANADDDDLDLSSLRDLMDTMRQAAKEIQNMTKPVVKTKKKENTSRPREQKRHHKKRNGRRRSSGHCQQIQAEVHVISEVTGHETTSLTSSDTSSQLSGQDRLEKQRHPHAANSPPTSPGRDVSMMPSGRSRMYIQERREKQLQRPTAVCLSASPGHAVSIIVSDTSEPSTEERTEEQCHPPAISPHAASPPTCLPASPVVSSPACAPVSPPASPPTAYLHVENEELSHTWPRRRGRSVSRQRSLSDNVPKPGSNSEGHSPVVLPPEYDLWVNPVKSNPGSAKGQHHRPEKLSGHQGHIHDSAESGTSHSKVASNMTMAPQQRSRRRGHAHRTQPQKPVSPTPPSTPQSVSIPLPDIFVSEYDVLHHQPAQQGKQQQHSPVDEEINIDIV